MEGPGDFNRSWEPRTAGSILTSQFWRICGASGKFCSANISGGAPRLRMWNGPTGSWHDGARRVSGKAYPSTRRLKAWLPSRIADRCEASRLGSPATRARGGLSSKANRSAGKGNGGRYVGPPSECDVSSARLPQRLRRKSLPPPRRESL